MKECIFLDFPFIRLVDASTIRVICSGEFQNKKPIIAPIQKNAIWPLFEDTLSSRDLPRHRPVSLVLPQEPFQFPHRLCPTSTWFSSGSGIASFPY
jgi:hypothetical protein